ncbi:DUF4806 domain-containing protein [Aphis craccivora]|uniref:DUF4806 domain-containing protein n=1 Tax=Aphis craccivora TaxID=307492 RepID=A0A6G0Y565_APHCR|nr:DUF4806 domain-containing protein [Aphis craccivora]
MWSIVAFKDNSVEVVPSNWFINELSASYSYSNNYKIAEEKTNRVILTSDLLTNKSQENDDKNKSKLNRKLSLDKQTKDIANFWSSDSCDIYDNSDTDPYYSPLTSILIQEHIITGKLSSPKYFSARKKLDFANCSSGSPYIMSNKIQKLKTPGK